VLKLLHEPRFADQAPVEIYATLLDEGIYHCSIRTMYRILDRNSEVRERRAQLRHPVYQKPELLAEGPNQVWSWDSRRSVHSMSAPTNAAPESSSAARPLIVDAVASTRDASRATRSRRDPSLSALHGWASSNKSNWSTCTNA